MMDDTVLCFHDDLALGPLWSYMTEEGRHARESWIVSNLFKYDEEVEQNERKEEMEGLEREFQDIVSEIQSDDTIIFWMVENTMEILGVGYGISLFTEYKNLFLIKIPQFSISTEGERDFPL